MRIAIIGGGIAGLSAAYQLELARVNGAEVEYHLFEASSRLGGVLSSTIADGSVLEGGPDSFLTEKPAAAQLCRELGLGADLIPSNDQERKTFILVSNRLVPLPDGLMFLVPTRLAPTALTPLFSWPTKFRMALEFFRRPRPHAADESVACLVRRHYGQQVVDRLASPLLSGIYGGDCNQLSAQSVLPRFVEMEAHFGSLTRGMLAARAAQAKRSQQPARATFTTLRGGLQQLVDALAGRLDARQIELGCPVERLERTGGLWRVVTANAASESAGEFDAVIVAAPAWSAGTMLRQVDEALAGELEAIHYSSSITVNLVFDQTAVPNLPEGFGFLVPESEQRSLLAMTFIHRKFPGRTAPGKAVLRAFLGGAHREAFLDEPDEGILKRVRADLRDILGIDTEPERVEIRRWRRAMAQYAVGHKARMARIHARVAGLSGLHLVGNAYDGIGISDCIRLGRQAATLLMAGATPQSVPATAQSRR
jgi:oxygen-dependent protoporphyrinogen oxidase